MNALYSEIQRLAPGYKPDASQLGQIERHSDPEGYARLLEGRMNDVRDDAVRYLSKVAPDLGITAGDITNHDAIAGIRAFHSSGISGADKKQLEGIGVKRILSIGIRVGKRLSAKGSLTIVDHLFLGFLGRLPRSGGRDYYQSRLSSGGEGNSLIDIVYEIYNSPEATSRRLNE